MITKKDKFSKIYNNLTRFEEDRIYQRNLLNITLFPYINNMAQAKIYNSILNFSLKEVNFNKKKALVFFFALELLTNQKCIATISSKNVLAWKLRKGALVGCKVTLRRLNLAGFLDNMALALPRMENFKEIATLSKLHSKHNFYKNDEFSGRIQKIAFPLIELVMFHTIELGLGVNTEVRKADIQFSFSSYNPLEQIFLLTSCQIPLKTI
jgi:ribosomal protein L5